MIANTNVIHELVNDIHDLVTWQLITPNKEQQHPPRAPAHLPRNYKVNNSMEGDIIMEGRHQNDNLSQLILKLLLITGTYFPLINVH
jgi:hypothetical protein